jgi:hypothetical protein
MYPWTKHFLGSGINTIPPKLVKFVTSCFDSPVGCGEASHLTVDAVNGSKDGCADELGGSPAIVRKKSQLIVQAATIVMIVGEDRHLVG